MDPVVLKAIASLLEKQVKSEVVAAALPYGAKQTVDKTIRLRVVADVSRDANDVEATVEQPLDGYALLWVLAQRDLLPDGLEEIVAAAKACKEDKDKDHVAEFADFRRTLHGVLPPKVQSRAAAIRVSGHVLDPKEVVR
jgi:hypothetical protein